jgi:large subunit ribosomal protein L23
MGIFSKKEESAKKADATKKPEKNTTKTAATKAKPASAKKETKKKVSEKSGNAYKVLVKPLITEKAGILGQENKYVFEVAVDTNKIEVAKAVEEVYGVKPVAVNIMNRQGKKVRRGRTFGKRKDWKKAIVELPEGKTISVYEGV